MIGGWSLWCCRWSLVLTMALGFAGAAFSTWARTDESGLFVIGVVLIFIGVSVAGAVLTVLIRPVPPDARPCRCHSEPLAKPTR